jgi:hypothetical protein
VCAVVLKNLAQTLPSVDHHTTPPPNRSATATADGLAERALVVKQVAPFPSIPSWALSVVHLEQGHAPRSEHIHPRG